jgi:N-acyl-D-aspartate/D-glutamate deacylase
MAYDLIIRGGMVVDGSGLPAYRADVGIVDGTIASIGDLKSQSADEVIDAEGHVVSPGFVDGHTHMDAQVFWDHIGSNSCWHGVTSVVMGNCGFSLAPCAESEKMLVLHNLPASIGHGKPFPNIWMRSRPCPRASTMPAMWAIRRCAPMSWARRP